MLFRRNQKPPADVAVLFVCMGNICRSPTAEAVFRAQVDAAGLTERVHIDSAGTHAYHIGSPPDQRSQETAAARGVSMDGQRARRVQAEDFDAFDYIVAMDGANLAILQDLEPEDARATLSLMLDHHPEAPFREVPDPYYGGASGFERVFDLVDAASAGLLAEVNARLAAARDSETEREDD